MTKVLKADVSGLMADAFATKALVFPGHWYMRYRWLVTAATLANLTSFGGDQNSAIPVNLSGSGGDGFLGVDFGSTGTWKTEGDFDPAYGAGSAAGLLTGDAWHTVLMEYDGVNIKWTFDGALLFNYALAPANADTPIQVGSTFTQHVAGEQIYYIADLVIGTTPGGNDIFDANFASGTLAAFDSETNPSALSLVDDPFPPPPSAPILISEPPWRFVMADVIFNGSSPPGFSTLTFLDHRATSRQLRYFLRKAPEASGQVPGDDPEVNIVQGGEPYVEEGVRILIGLRREGGTPPWKPRFAGPILQATRSVQGDAPFVDFTAYGPRQLLYLRPVRRGDGLLLGTQGLTFKQQKGSDILLALLNRTETADGPTFIDFTTGTLEDTDPIDINFQQGSSVGEALDQLEATGTIDVLLPTVYDPVGSPGILAQLNIYVQAGSIKRSAIMAWDLPGRNLDEINWLEDGAQRANNVELYTSDGVPTPIVFDAASIAKYGSYWGQQTYPVQTQLAAVEAQAGAQLLISKGHPETLTLGPTPGRAPIPFNEWWLADWLPTYASARLGKKINGLLRVYDFTLNLEDDSTETVRDMLVSANKQPA